MKKKKKAQLNIHTLSKCVLYFKRSKLCNIYQKELFSKINMRIFVFTYEKKLLYKINLIKTIFLQI